MSKGLKSYTPEDRYLVAKHRVDSAGRDESKKGLGYLAAVDYMAGHGKAAAARLAKKQEEVEDV